MHVTKLDLASKIRPKVFALHVDRQPHTVGSGRVASCKSAGAHQCLGLLLDLLRHHFCGDRPNMSFDR